MKHRLQFLFKDQCEGLTDKQYEFAKEMMVRVAVCSDPYRLDDEDFLTKPRRSNDDGKGNAIARPKVLHHKGEDYNIRAQFTVYADDQELPCTDESTPIPSDTTTLLTKVLRIFHRQLKYKDPE